MMRKEQLSALEEKARLEYEEKLKAIQIVKQMLEDEEAAGISEALGAVEPEEASEGQTIIGSIEGKMHSYPERQWTAAQLRTALERDGFRFKAKNPNVSINVAANKLIERGIARMVRRGKGTRANIYQAAVPKENPQEENFGQAQGNEAKPALSEIASPIPPKEQYPDGVGPTPAVLARLEATKRGMTANELVDDLIKSGFEFVSSRPTRTVHQVLRRLYDQRKVKRYKTKNGVRWKILEVAGAGTGS